MADNNVQLARQVLEYVKDMRYPTHRRDLAEHARQKHAPAEVIAVLERRIPEEIYDNLADVREGLRRGGLITPAEEQSIPLP